VFCFANPGSLSNGTGEVSQPELVKSHNRN
jgi:hypothetical protein